MIIRRRHTANFTTIGNVLFEDERLAADEVGILAYLLSRPHDWEVRRPALQRRWGMGRDAIKRVVSNLVRFGWCIARKDRLPNGTFFMIYEIRDEPGPTLTDEEVRRALSLVSSEAASDESDVISGPNIVPDQHRETGDPPTPYPSLADPSPGKAEVAYIDIQNKDLPRTDTTQKPEREGARAREKHAVNLVEFKRRWPTNASDDQHRVDRAWYALSNEEGEEALAGIAPFMENQKRLGRKHPPAGFTFLEQKRWTLLEQPKPESAVLQQFELSSREGRAIAMLYEIAGKTDFFFRIICRGRVVYSKLEMTPSLLALADLPARNEWQHTASRNEAGAWNRFIGERLGNLQFRVVEGASLPKPFPPKVDGSWSPTGPPGPSDEDLQALANEGQK